MKNYIFLLVLFLPTANFLISPAFSQEVRSSDPATFEKETSNLSHQSKTLRHSILTDFFRPDTAKTEEPKSWWETLLDFSFWTKLSGPGPFFGLGVDYPIFKRKDVFAVFIGTSFSNSIDNTLKYNKTVVDTIAHLDTSHNFLFFTVERKDSCVQCNESKAVQMVSLKVNVHYHIPRSRFDLFLGGGLHTFFGEAFKSFSRVSGTFGTGWRVLKYLRVGLMVNVFEHFRPSKFGAVDGKDSTGSVEFVPGAFIGISLF